MAAVFNKWILIIIMTLSVTVICHAEDKPNKTKPKTSQINSTSSYKSKLSRNIKDKEDTLVYEKISEDTLIFDDKTNEDTLIFSDDEIGQPNTENFNWVKNSENSGNNDINFSVSQSNFSGEISVNIDSYTSETLEMIIFSSEGKLIFSKKIISKNTISENLKPGIYYIYVKSSLRTSYKKILVK